ncbi:type IV secretory pathway VirD2 relaxase [Sphingomonas kyeonggiensis]|uniref:relaxase/mobilization nuclease RlxS n=1 Tax=Sphingomonas kyeonggiensis TaxID=1268553 RepID=UPI00278AFC8C|nr:relaxase/mobilization nuclease RlxS [Sphingomonas kyeonggiensis]MDQ0249508.1 type IV secretory pathway VirD2 relaxase [Sphingomonas kyeonggiensis]
MSEDEFTPRLGKPGAKDAKRLVKYGGRVLAAARLAGSKTGVLSRRFDGSRIGRGAGIGRLLSSRDRFAGARARRAMVKVRLVRMAVTGLAAARAHLRYIQRDGVTRDGNPGELYGRDIDAADGKAFLDRCAGDRHHFRFIVSAEDGAEYPDLKPYVRRLMAQAEHDLSTRLDWVAVDHFNTDNPHTHIMLRGIDDQGQNLVIAREYIAHGLRERAAELATLDLGPRTDREIQDRLRHDVEQERLTAIDRRLLSRMDADRITGPAHNDPFQQAVATGRLRKLSAMGLAEDLGSGRWRLADGLEETLRRMGERGDIIRLMQRELTARRLERAQADRVIEGELREQVIGRVVRRGSSDEHRDRHYLIVDGIDGRAHYLDIGRAIATEATPEGAIVRVAPRTADVREVDRTIASVAASHDGRYSVAHHLEHDPRASRAFAEAHVRRLEALRRAGFSERLPDGSWAIRENHVEQAAAYEARQLRDRPVAIETLSTAPIERLASADGPTWLDRTLAGEERLVARDAGFGREVRDALAARRQWLVEQGLADEVGNGVSLKQGAMALLQRRELLRIARELTDELGKTHVEAVRGARIEGRLTRQIEAAGERYALVERSREFTLVRWRPVLERQLGKPVAGILRSDGINWRFGRARGGPDIS